MKIHFRYKGLLPFGITNQEKVLRATREADVILDKDPDHIPSLMVLADYDFEKNQFNKAVDQYNEILKIHDDINLKRRIANCYFNLRLFAEAARNYEAVVKDKKLVLCSNLFYWVMKDLRDTYFFLNDVDKVQHYNKLLSEAPFEIEED